MKAKLAQFCHIPVCNISTMQSDIFSLFTCSQQFVADFEQDDIFTGRKHCYST